MSLNPLIETEPGRHLRRRQWRERWLWRGVVFGVILMAWVMAVVK